MAELGARYQLTPQTVLSGSVGTGFGDRPRSGCWSASSTR